MSIEEIIEKSFNDLIKAITTDGTSSQLIFPKYRNKTVRYSEQELKQIFLRNVEEDGNYFYSVETPTEYVYCISNSDNPTVKEVHEKDDNYKSARFDVSLYNTDYKVNDNASHHIEFKYGNPKKKTPICKDFLKLAKEVKLTNEKKNFFVHYYYVERKTGWESRSFKTLFEDYRKSVDEMEKEEDLSKVIVYLVCIHGKDKSASTYHFSLADLKDNYTVGTKYSNLKEKDWLNEEIFNSGEEI